MSHLHLAPGYRFQWEPTQNAHVLLYPEGLIQLNDSAAVILSLCDGQRDAEGVIHALIEKFPEADPLVIAADVHEFLEVARERGWLKA